MFQLLLVEDTVILNPDELLNVLKSVEMRLNARYLCKVI